MTRRQQPGDHPRTQTGAAILLRPETAAQRSRWEAAAKRDGRPLTQWIRRALDDAAKKKEIGV